MLKNKIKVLNNTNALTYNINHPFKSILLHVCNDCGVMGSGIALQISNKFPSAYTNYKLSCKLGTVSYDDNKKVANLVAQRLYIGYNKDCYKGKRYINYGSLVRCFYALDINEDVEIIIPYNMGSDRAGGNFKIILELLIEFFPLNTITICKL